MHSEKSIEKVRLELEQVWDANLLFYSRKGHFLEEMAPSTDQSPGTDHRTMEAIGAVGHAAG